MTTTATRSPRRRARAESWVPTISAAWRESVEGIVRVGARLREAQAELPQGEWSRLFPEHASCCSPPLPFSRRTAAMLVAIAEHPVLSNAHHGARLPASWRTLYELARVEPVAVLEAAIDAGRITAETTRAQARELYLPPHRGAEREMPAEQRARRELERLVGKAKENAIAAWVHADRAGDRHGLAYVARRIASVAEFLERMLAERGAGDR